MRKKVCVSSFLFFSHLFYLIIPVFPTAIRPKNDFVYCNYFHLSSFHQNHIFGSIYISAFHTGWLQKKSVWVQFFVFYIFPVSRFSLFKSSICLLIVTTEHPKSFVNCFWAVLRLHWFVSTFSRSTFFQKPHSDFESMVYVLGIIKWIHNDRTSHLTKAKKKHFFRVVFVFFQNHLKVFACSSGKVCSKLNYSWKLRNKISQQKQKVLSFNPIVSKKQRLNE